MKNSMMKIALVLLVLVMVCCCGCVCNGLLSKNTEQFDIDRNVLFTIQNPELNFEPFADVDSKYIY